MARHADPVEIHCDIDGIEELAYLHKTLEANGVAVLESTCTRRGSGFRGRFVTLAPEQCQQVLEDLGVSSTRRSAVPKRARSVKDRLESEARAFADGAQDLLEETQESLAEDR